MFTCWVHSCLFFLRLFSALGRAPDPRKRARPLGPRPSAESTCATLPPPPPPAPLRAFLSGRHTIPARDFFGDTGGGPCAPWMRAKFVPTLWGMGGFQSNHHATLREGGRSEEERGWWGGGRRKEEKQAGTLQLHKHAKEKKSVMQQSFIVVVVVARSCSCRATNFAGVEE